MPNKRQRNNNNNKNKPAQQAKAVTRAATSCRGYIDVDLNRVTQNDKDRLEMVEKVAQWYSYAIKNINWAAVDVLNSWSSKLKVPLELVRVFRDLNEAKSQILSYAPLVIEDLNFYRNNIGISFGEFFSDATTPGQPLDLSNMDTKDTTALFLAGRLNFGGSLSLANVVINNREILHDAAKKVKRDGITGQGENNTISVPTRLDFHDLTKSFFAHFVDKSTPSSEYGMYIVTVAFLITSKTGNIRVTSVIPYSNYESSYSNPKRLVETTAEMLYKQLGLASSKSKSRLGMKSSNNQFM